MSIETGEALGSVELDRKKYQGILIPTTKKGFLGLGKVDLSLKDQAYRAEQLLAVGLIRATDPNAVGSIDILAREVLENNQPRIKVLRVDVADTPKVEKLKQKLILIQKVFNEANFYGHQEYYEQLPGLLDSLTDER